MRRRELITLLSGTVIWPFLASAQQPARMPRVVQLSPVDIPAQANQLGTRLRELGYVEGHNIRLEFLNAAANVDALPALAQELVGKGDLDVIVAISSPAALAAFKATQTIPIIAFAAVDPVGSGTGEQSRQTRSERDRRRGFFRGNYRQARGVDARSCAARGPPWYSGNQGQQGSTKPCPGLGDRSQTRLYG